MVQPGTDWSRCLLQLKQSPPIWHRWPESGLKASTITRRRAAIAYMHRNQSSLPARL
jgi:hypothetical protein